jgi:PKD repeat protein
MERIQALGVLAMGGTSTDEDPSHTYTAAGVYTVCLTVIDSACLSEDSSCHVIDLTVGISDVQSDENEIFIAPNPASTFINLSISGENVNSIHLLNVIGAEITELQKQLMQEASTTRLELPDLSSGIYFLRIETNNGFITRKFIVEKD